MSQTGVDAGIGPDTLHDVCASQDLDRHTMNRIARPRVPAGAHRRNGLETRARARRDA
jgi:hypothetical protein